MQHKITTGQVAQIDAALAKAGINYADIRMELTDHIATALEQEEGNGDFEHRLKGYILNNKKAIRKMNFAAMRVASRRSLRTFVQNIFTLHMLLITLVMLAGGKLASQYLDKDDLVTLMFFVFSTCTVISCYRPLYNLVRKRKDYSFTHGLGFIPGLLLYPSLFMIRWLNKLNNINYIILYYVVVSVIALNIYFTTKKLFDNYKLRYNG
ncbi:hypothetical protein [Flavobacterium psychrotrophum]|uniref:hypothetical protein n=1 Tax=Flavobacterium psychrotrophum TaxID=2294119 RepID=UPI000E31178A|nr:hypothetical protein [Flavobacterium psychrotrophum]